jgi:DNA-binding transcriptional LysR family regulator
MQLDQLRTLLAVIEHASFTRAAHRLHVSQSTVSFQIRSLEEAVGTTLLDRVRGGVRPTTAGRTLARYAARIEALTAEALGRINADESGLSGRVVVAASTIPADYLLPPALAKLRATHAGVDVDVLVSDSQRALDTLLAGECDLALVGTRPRDRRILASRFADDEIVLVGPSPNPFAPDDRLQPRELARVPLVLREQGSGTQAAVAALLARHAGSASRIRVGSTELARRCVTAGLGLSFLSRRAVAEDVASRKLRIVKLTGTPLHRVFYVARIRSGPLPAAARALLTVLQSDVT